MIIKKIKANSFTILILLFMIISIIYPKPGLFISSGNRIAYLTFAAMFLSGLGLSLGNFKDGLKNYKNIIYCFISVYIFFPIVVTLVIWILKAVGANDPNIFIGAIILSAQSSTLISAIVLTETGNGNVSLAIIATIINNVTSIFMTPIILRLMTSANETIAFDTSGMIIKLLLILVFPVVLAQISRLLLNDKILMKIAGFRKFASKFVVLMIVLGGGSAASADIVKSLDKVVIILAVVVVLHVIMLMLAALYIRFAKVDRASGTAVMMAASQKTLPASLVVWSGYFAAYTTAPIMLVLYHAMQNVVDSFIMSRRKI